MSTIRWMCRLWDPRTVGRALMMVVALVLVVAVAAAGQLRPEVTGEIGLETRGFFRGPLLDEQARHDASLLLQGELYWSWDGGNQSLTVEPFLRLDTADSERTHVDFRVFSWEKVWDRWELRAGLRRAFWGVTESQHLVDVINQTDLVENLDGEDKLGQPMVSLAAVRDWGDAGAVPADRLQGENLPGRGRPAALSADGRHRGRRVRVGGGPESPRLGGPVEPHHRRFRPGCSPLPGHGPGAPPRGGRGGRGPASAGPPLRRRRSDQPGRPVHVGRLAPEVRGHHPVGGGQTVGTTP